MRVVPHSANSSINTDSAKHAQHMTPRIEHQKSEFDAVDFNLTMRLGRRYRCHVSEMVRLVRELPVAIHFSNQSAGRTFGGEGGIRTHGPREGTPVFKTGAFNRSATSPACADCGRTLL